MQNNLSTLEEVTCYAIIIAMAVAILKQSHYSIGSFARSLSPFRNRRIINSLSERLEECEMEKDNTNQKFIKIKGRIKKVEKLTGIKKNHTKKKK